MCRVILVAFVTRALARVDGGMHKSYAVKAANTVAMRQAPSRQSWAPSPPVMQNNAPRQSWAPSPPVMQNMVEKLERSWNSPISNPVVAQATSSMPKMGGPLDGAFHKAHHSSTAAYGASSPVSNVQTSWLPEPNLRSSDEIPWNPEPQYRSPEPQYSAGQGTGVQATSRNDGGFFKAYASFAGKATNPSAMSSVPGVQTSWLSGSKSPEPQYSAGQGAGVQATSRNDGGFFKAYASFAGKATNPSSVSSVPGVQSSWLSGSKSPEHQYRSPEPQYSAGQGATSRNDGGFFKSYASFAGKATNPSPVSSVPGVQTSWLSGSKSPEPQYSAGQGTGIQATSRNDGGFFKAYASFAGKATNPSPVSSVPGVQSSWLSGSKSPEPQYRSPEPQYSAGQGTGVQATSMNDGGFFKAYASFAGKATNPSPVSSVSGGQTSWLSGSKSPEPQYPARQDMVQRLEKAWNSPTTNTNHKAYAASFQPNLVDAETHSKSFILGLSGVATLILALVGLMLKKFRSSRKPVQDPLLYTQIA